MAASVQQALSSNAQIAILRVLSRPRFQTYMTAAGHDVDLAWRLYLWNARVGEAFHLPIQTAEVGLRNSIDVVLIQLFGPDWGANRQFELLLDQRAQADLGVVKQRLKNKGRQANNGQIVASLSFGFWVALLHRKYNPQIWSQHLQTGFPNKPSTVDRHQLFVRAGEINKLRNRISHHEPIIGSDISKRYSEITEFLD